jgi:short-subunit dehydrogenase
MAPYNVAKAGTISLSETLRSELAPHDIGVTVVCPSFFNTNLLDDMTCTDEWERDFARATFESAGMTADEIAGKVVRAVERNKLYVMPQPSAKFLWLVKRIAPGGLFSLLSYLNRSGRRDSIFMSMAKKGLMG